MSTVLFAVTGWDPAFEFCLQSIREYSPTTDIVILGDKVTADHVRDYKFEPIEDYFVEATKFAAVFENHSPNPHDFELICFQRWFVMREYAKAHKLKAFWTFDWDVLVFTDLAKETIGVGMTAPAGCFFCQNLGWLGQWLDMVMEAYRKRNELFHQWLRVCLHDGQHVMSDNTIMYYTCRHLWFLFEPLGTECWDNNLATSDGFKMANGGKALEWSGGYPYGELENGQKVRLKALHCWGPHKERMARYLKMGRDSKNKFNGQGDSAKKVVFDIGAHKGTTFDFWLSKTDAFNGARVYCFEPSPRNMAALLKRCGELRHRFRISVCPFALGREGVSEFYQKHHPDGFGDSFTADHDVPNDDCGYQMLIGSWSLSRAMNQFTTPEDELYLKIDAECSEMEMLDDLLAHPELLKRVRQLLVEFHPICSVERREQLQQAFVAAGCPITPWEF